MVNDSRNATVLVDTTATQWSSICFLRHRSMPRYLVKLVVGENPVTFGCSRAVRFLVVTLNESVAVDHTVIIGL